MPGGRDLIERVYAAFAAKDGPRWCQVPRRAGLVPGWTALARSGVRRGARAALGQFLASGGHAG